MNGQAEDHSPLAKAVDDLEHIRGRRFPLAWKQLERLNAVNAAATDLEMVLDALIELRGQVNYDSVIWNDARAALDAYRKATAL